ncbi:MAG: dehydrogenase, partial [Myxococcaceae bacterium]|nr:dehydrogenase [Myxococcaceae bacterium]
AASFWLSLFVLPLLVTAHSTLGFIFGLQGGRPGWFSALQAPSFVVMAGVSGIGVLIVIAAVIRRVLHLEDMIGVNAFRWLGGFLWVLIVALLYFIIADELTASYAASGKERDFAHALVSGPYANLFFLEIGSLVTALAILFFQFAVKKTVIGWTVAAGLIVNIAAVLKRYLLVVPSQTHGMLLPHPNGHYVPSAVEWGLLLGVICVATLLFSVFMWCFPIVPLEAHADNHHPLAPDKRRLGLTFVAMGVGACIAVVGFVISSRYGVVHYRDPIIPYSPVLFITGVMLIFGSAALYEVLPPRRSRPAPAPTPDAEGPAPTV